MSYGLNVEMHKQVRETQFRLHYLKYLENAVKNDIAVIDMRRQPAVIY